MPFLGLNLPESTRLWCQVAVIFSGLMVASALLAEETGSIVFGSFLDSDSADRTRRRLDAEGLQTRVVEIDIRGTTFYRVLGRPGRDMDRLRREMDDIRRRIQPDVWLYITSTAEDVRAEPAVASDPLMSAVSPPAGEPDQEMAEPADQSDQAATVELSSDELPAVVVPAVLLTSATPSTQGGVQATSEPLRVARYDDVDIRIDGVLDEAVWQEVQAYDNMTVIEPDTLEPGRFRTESRFLYTDRGLYVSTLNLQPLDSLLERLSIRDQVVTRDGVEVTIDPTGEGLYGYWFGVNLGGTLNDGQVLPERQISKQWDGPWYGNAAEAEGGWSAEMFLPWSMMAMPDAGDQRTMSMYVSRRVAHLDENWSWPALPQTGSRFMSALQPFSFTGVNPTQQFSVYPYSSAVYDKIDSDTDYRVGTDIFWRPSSNLQLTLGINPDFGTVESDDVVINLTAFESFFPEKRLFFLEGSEIFITSPRSSVAERTTGSSARRTSVNFNPEPTTLVNTRRIGGAANRPDIPAGVIVPGVELSKPTELAGAAKVTGQMGAIRFGVMAAVEEDSTFQGTWDNGDPARLTQDGREFGVARLLYEDTNNGRKSIGWLSTLVSHPDQDAVVHAMDAHYLSPSSKWKLDGQLMFSDVADVEGAGGFVNALYIPKSGSTHSLGLDYFDEDLDVDDLGFIRRNDTINFVYAYNYSTSDLSYFRNRTNSMFVSQEYNIDGLVTRSGLFWRSSWTLHNLSQVRTEFDYFPARWDDRNSRGNGTFRIPVRLVSEISYGTDTSRPVSISAAVGRRQEESGGWRTTGKAGITYKPNHRFSFDLDVNYARRDDWLLYQGGRNFTTFDATDWQPNLAMGIFFTARQQLRLTLQWAGIRADEKSFFVVPDKPDYLEEVTKDPSEPTDDFTISRVTAQIRYRWEIAPLSDLFIVYTRGGNLPNRIDDEFEDLYHDSIADPIVNYFVVKLRYRFGN